MSTDLLRSVEYFRYQDAEVQDFQLAAIGSSNDANIVPGESYVVTSGQNLQHMDIYIAETSGGLATANPIAINTGITPFRFTAMGGQFFLRVTPRTSVDNIAVIKVTPS